jgi:AmiR/NasT family two-component response regulator
LEAKGAGVSGYILKPFSLLQLESRLRIAATKAQKLAVGQVILRY